MPTPKSYTSTKKTPRPYITTSRGQRIPLGFAARKTLGKYSTGGTRIYSTHIVGGRLYRSHDIKGETWHGENAITFRVRRWYKKWNPSSREVVQDQYPYWIPSSINNPEGAASRTALAQAVLNWQTVLTEAEKIEYNRRASEKKGKFGYHLYISEYIKSLHL